MGRKNKQFWESVAMNNATWAQYARRLTELSISMFEWKNLPNTVDPRFLELTLFGDGQAVFFRDEVMGYLALQCAANGNFNQYRIPMRRRAYAVNGYQKVLDTSDSVIIYNNYLRTNSWLDVQMFAKRLYNLDRAIDVNANAQKTPILLLCDESQRLTLENLYMQYDGNIPVIMGDRGLNTNIEIKAISTQAPFVCDQLYELKTQLWNEALTYLGISSVNNVKKERLITDEVTRNLGATVASRYSRLQARKEACDQINRLFGLNIDCEYRSDIRYIENEDQAPAVDEEVEQNERVHN